MKFLTKHIDYRILRNRCMKNIKEHQDEIKVMPLKRVLMSKNVARMGLFHDGAMVSNIPYITWYCDQYGNIGNYWSYDFMLQSCNYGRFKYLFIDQHLPIVRVPMGRSNKKFLQNLSKKIWFKAKLDGSLDEIF